MLYTEILIAVTRIATPILSFVAFRRSARTMDTDDSEEELYLESPSYGG
jgi:hypothetical protein